MSLVRLPYKDAFNPTLYSSPPLNVSAEQLSYIQSVIETSASDSKFAEKAFRAILRILTGGNSPIPVITALNPGTVRVGDPSFVLHVVGTGFAASSIIVWNGGEEPTVWVSATELTTGVNMDLVTVGSTVTVAVQNPDGTLSAAVNFLIQDAPPIVMSAKTELKKEVKK